MIVVTYPSYPSPTGPVFAAPQPGLYPLRPLTVGEILTAALRIARRHLGLLAPIALVISALNASVMLGVLAWTGYLKHFANGDYARTPANPTQADVDRLLSQFGHILLGVGAGLIVTLICAPILAAIASPLAAQAATSRSASTSAGLSWLKGRWTGLLVAGVAAGLLTSFGYALLLVPGIMLWLVLMPVGPVAAMEGSPVGETLRRAAALSKGFKGRILGVTLLAALFSGIVSYVASAIFTGLIKGDDAVTNLLIAQALSSVVAAFTSAWAACVTAMLYIDIRMRREGLAHALLASTTR